MKEQIIQTFYENANQTNKIPMENYMRNQFKFLGIRTDTRNTIQKSFLKQIKTENHIDWDFIFTLWDKAEREFQYLALSYIKTLKHLLTVNDIDNLKQLVIRKSWWDTIDTLDKIIGNISYPSDFINYTMLEWSKDENIWLRRVAIDHQLLRKDKTNTKLLEDILKNNFNQKEFFINKAMGWALRDYSKTNAAWVRNFLDKYSENLSLLTIKEASKYI